MQLQDGVTGSQECWPCDIEQSPTRGHALSAWYSAQRPVVLGSWNVTRLGVFTPGSRLPVCPATGNKAKSASPQRSGQGITLRGAESSTPLTVSPLPPGPWGASGGRILLPPRRTVPVDDWPQQLHWWGGVEVPAADLPRPSRMMVSTAGTAKGQGRGGGPGPSGGAGGLQRGLAA